MRARHFATIIGVAGLTAITVLVASRVIGDGSPSLLGASDAFERSLAEGCTGDSVALPLLTDLVPLNVTTIIELPGATAVATRNETAYVGTREGTIVTWSLSDQVSRPFLDLSHDTAVGSDQGLLNLVVTPDGGALLVMRTAADGDVVITAHLLDTDESAIELLRIDQPDPRHNGGGLAFGPDGNLFVGVGDGGGQGDPTAAASDPRRLLGSVLRVTVDLVEGTLRPVDMGVAKPEARHGLVWATGVRNPFRLWFDQSGQLWVADVGELCREEVTVLSIGDTAPDLGWSAFEGTATFDRDRLGKRAVTPPFVDYGHDAGACAVVGGTQYEGDIDELAGSQIIADVCTGKVMAIIGSRLVQIPVQFESPVDVNIGPDDQLWITDISVGVRRVTRAAAR